LNKAALALDIGQPMVTAGRHSTISPIGLPRDDSVFAAAFDPFG